MHDLEDQQIFREWLESQIDGTEAAEGSGESSRPRRFDDQMLVHGEILSDFVRQSFLDPNDGRIVDKILDAVIPGAGGIRFGDIMTRDQAKTMLAKAQEKMLGGRPEAIPVSPQQRRQGARKRLADRPKSVAARVVRDLGLAPAGIDVARVIPEVRGSQNLVAVIRLIHKGIDEQLGIGRDQRNTPSGNQTETAMDELDHIGDNVRARIRQLLEAEK